LGLVAGGCRQAAGGDAMPDASVVGDRISFPAGAPPLELLGVETAQPSAGGRSTLFRRPVWDDDATARVFTPVARRGRRVLVHAGDDVRAGSPLAEVESPDFGQAQAEARTAESDLQLAAGSLARVRDLYEHGAAAHKEIEAAEADRARAAAQEARTRA